MMECVPLFLERLTKPASDEVKTPKDNSNENSDVLCCICLQNKCDIMLECCVYFIITLSISFVKNV